MEVYLIKIFIADKFISAFFIKIIIIFLFNIKKIWLFYKIVLYLYYNK